MSGTKKLAERMCAEWPWLTEEQRRLIVRRSDALQGSEIWQATSELCAMATRFAIENQFAKAAKAREEYEAHRFAMLTDCTAIPVSPDFEGWKREGKSAVSVTTGTFESDDEKGDE